MSYDFEELNQLIEDRQPMVSCVNETYITKEENGLLLRVIMIVSATLTVHKYISQMFYC